MDICNWNRYICLFGKVSARNMNKQIKRLLIAELSSKRNLEKFINEDLPVIVKRFNDDVTFYMLVFDEDNTLFNFERCVKSDDVTFFLKEKESYTIDDLKQELNLSESWFEPFVNEE